MFPTQNPAFPKCASRLSSDFSGLLGGNKGFSHHFIDTGAQNKVSIDILGFK